MNGLLVYGIILSSVAVSHLALGYTFLSWIYDHYLELMTSAILFSFILSLHLYFKSYSRGALLADGGTRALNVVNA